jgi:two-component system, OmpR family, phosphate regulon sensor histidine kinase PhoR
MRIKVQLKLLLIFFLSWIAILGVGYVYIKAHLRTYLEENLNQNLMRELFLSRQMLEAYLPSGLNQEAADAFADTVGGALGVRLTVIGLDGKVLGDSQVDKEGLKKVENHLDRPEIQEALKQGTGFSRRYSYTLKKYMLYMATVFGKGRPAGFVRMAMAAHDVSIFEQRLQGIFAAALGMLVVLTLLMSFLISALISSPLKQVTHFARALAKGEPARLPIGYRQDEIGELARVLNSMSEEIKDKIKNVVSGQARLEAVLSSMFEGIMVTNACGEILLVNPSLRRLFLIDGVAEGRRPLEIIRNNAVQDMVDRIIKEKQSLATEEITVNLPEEKTVKVNAVPITIEAKLEGAVLVFHDITELKRLERIRQDFVANVSHELRTPISSIQGYSETLLSGALNDKDNAEDFVKIIYHDSERLAKLIEDLLDLAKIESGRMKMVFMPLDLGSLVDRTIKIIEPQAKAKDIKITVEFPVSLPKAMADESRVSQVLINLLDNAVKYSPQSVSVKVSVSLQSGFLEVKVADNGIGIPEEDLSRIFERFYRVDKARSRELGGTGLGLSIVKHIVLAHGGTVLVNSVLGKCSTFIFTLPVA